MYRQYIITTMSFNTTRSPDRGIGSEYDLLLPVKIDKERCQDSFIPV